MFMSTNSNGGSVPPRSRNVENSSSDPTSNHTQLSTSTSTSSSMNIPSSVVSPTDSTLPPDSAAQLSASAAATRMNNSPCRSPRTSPGSDSSSNKKPRLRLLLNRSGGAAENRPSGFGGGGETPRPKSSPINHTSTLLCHSPIGRQQKAPIHLNQPKHNTTTSIPAALATPKISVNKASTDKENLKKVCAILKKCLENLGTKQPLNPKELLSWSMLVNRCLSTPDRTWRNVENVFRVIRGSGLSYDKHAVPIIASLFYNIVVLMIDNRLNEKISNLLRDEVYDPQDGSSCLVCKIPYQDPYVRMTRKMFDYVLGPHDKARRHMDEMSEYLCALTAVKLFRNTLSTKHLFQLVACIEATIPFRPFVDHATTQPMEGLYNLLQGTNEEFNVGMSDEELVETVQQAALFANCDLKQFCGDDPVDVRDFRIGTIPERYAIFRNEDKCTLQDIFMSFSGIVGIHHVMRKSNVFQSFRGKPCTPEELQHMEHMKDKNTDIVTKYFQTRCFTMLVLMDALRIIFPDNALPTPGNNTRRYVTILRNRTNGCLSFMRQVESGFPPVDTLNADSPKESDEEGNATNKNDDPVYRCFTTARPMCTICNWDATSVTNLSATIYVTVPWDDIAANSEGANVGTGHFFSLLPTKVRRQLVNLIEEVVQSKQDGEIKMTHQALEAYLK